MLLSQNSKLVKALQESGLAAETGAERVGVFGLENVRNARPARRLSLSLPPARRRGLACLSVCVPR